MKALNDFLGKVGTDKALHFAFGGWIEAKFVELCGINGIAPGMIFVLLISIFKEYVLDKDSEPDWEDIEAAILGSAVEIITFILLGSL